MTEEWRDIRDWEDIYQVSNLGRVRSLDRVIKHRSRHGTIGNASLKGRILKPWTHQNGYLVVYLSDRTRGRSISRRVHQLVCEAFYGPRPEGHEVAHYDAVKINNAASNLRWATHYENMQDRYGRERNMALAA